jgi:hypothetical protein
MFIGSIYKLKTKEQCSFIWLHILSNVDLVLVWTIEFNFWDLRFYLVPHFKKCSLHAIVNYEFIFLEI